MSEMTWSHVENLTTTLAQLESQNQQRWSSSFDYLKNLTAFAQEDLTTSQLLSSYLNNITMEMGVQKVSFQNMSLTINELNDEASLIKMGSEEYFKNITVILDSLIEPPGN